MREFFRRIYYLLNRRQMERELQNDIEAHREMMSRENRKDFGNALLRARALARGLGLELAGPFSSGRSLRFAHVAEEPRLHRGGHGGLGAGHRREHSAVQRGLWRASEAASLRARQDKLVVLRQEFSKTSQNTVGFSVKEIQDYREQTKSIAAA